MIKKNNNDIKKVYKGTNEIGSILKNNEYVYKKGSYTLLKLLKSTAGNASTAPYIKTGYYHNANTRYELKFEFYFTSREWMQVFGARTTWNNNDAFNLAVHNRNMFATNIGGYTDDYLLSCTYNRDYEISYSKTKFICNGNEYPIGANSLTNCQYEDYIFGLNQKNNLSDFISMGLYYFKIYENDTLIYDFIPVLDENNVACLYEKNNRRYYYNANQSSQSNFDYETL